MINVILCGGSGERLWPLSRKKMPKQFIDMFSGQSLFQQTVLRNVSFSDSFLIICNAEHYFLAKNQFDALHLEKSARYLLEPVGRNTAPAIALACYALDQTQTLLVTPSDHLVKGETEYHKALKRAEQLAETGSLVTFGIRPVRPETGYGYIQCRGQDVLQFHEKPDLNTARTYLDSGDFLWNSGMFCFRSSVFLKELECHAPAIQKTAKRVYDSAEHDMAIRFDKKLMLEVPSSSIDFAVMERSSNIKVVGARFQWSDLGSFDTLAHSFPEAPNGNRGTGDVLFTNSKNCFVLSKHKRTVLIDTDDLIVIDTPDNLLITRAGSSREIKNTVSRLRKQDPQIVDEHWQGHRPWGQFSVLEEAEGYKIKKIVVRPGKRLSLQKHQFRSEHWVVVHGTAHVTVGNSNSEVQVNESTFIPIGQIHRLENRGDKDLVIIEVQVGSYTGEDDIVRIEDDFKRYIPD
jgi:mannose-1-phosphate guanylyltransferase